MGGRTGMRFVGGSSGLQRCYCFSQQLLVTLAAPCWNTSMLIFKEECVPGCRLVQWSSSSTTISSFMNILLFQLLNLLSFWMNQLSSNLSDCDPNCPAHSHTEIQHAECTPVRRNDSSAFFPFCTSTRLCFKDMPTKSLQQLAREANR